ncbi:hypothetical protein [Terasakiella sp. SH-1]|uniref:carbapenem self-resistance protein CarG family protein n=1 Tax=Terasakiella sp. SH-1 TaxID=2560057 RepID=UPI0010738DBE|nr:hypothetical protein [Terasakiella sp. SH-1]
MKWMSIFFFLFWVSPLKAEIIELEYGVNALDLDGDGIAEQVIKTWRENFNAHGYKGYLFIGEENGVSNTITYLSPEKKIHRDMMYSSERAECTVQDYFLLQKEGRVELVRALIPFGQKKVHFHYFKLMRNKEGIPGDPHRYWMAYKNKTSQYDHCDVIRAMKLEGLR